MTAFFVANVEHDVACMQAFQSQPAMNDAVLLRIAPRAFCPRRLPNVFSFRCPSARSSGSVDAGIGAVRFDGLPSNMELVALAAEAFLWNKNCVRISAVQVLRPGDPRLMKAQACPLHSVQHFPLLSGQSIIGTATQNKNQEGEYYVC